MDTGLQTYCRRIDTGNKTQTVKHGGRGLQGQAWGRRITTVSTEKITKSPFSRQNKKAVLDYYESFRLPFAPNHHEWNSFILHEFTETFNTTYTGTKTT